jgi:two-component system sensor histidine kinase TctE
VRAFAIARALPDPDRNGWAYVILAQTTEARNALAREITSGAMVIVAIMVFIALAGTLLAVRYALRPVAILAETLKVRDPEDLTPLDAPVPKELKPFIGSINFFMHRLDERVIRLQHFIADAAHQIRTPLTALSAQIDMLGDKPDAARVERLRQRTEELSNLTNQLLSHAMVIHRSATAPLVGVDLVEVARTAFNHAIPMTVDPDIIIAFEASQTTIVVRGDALSVREAISNLISNALRHGAISRLDVRVSAADGLAKVEVEDDGPGIPEENWVTVAQRFAVTDGNRPRVSGLGFAIAAEVAAAHQGRISFRRGSGFAVILEIPMTQGGA